MQKMDESIPHRARMQRLQKGVWLMFNFTPVFQGLLPFLSGGT